MAAVIWPRFVAVGALLVALAAGPVLAQSGSWNVDADGNWSTTTNWLGGTVASGNAATATFANDITATRTITIDGTSARVIGNVVFGDANASSAAGWIVSGQGLTINNNTNSGTITVNALGAGSTATISSVVAGGTNMPSIIKNGAGTLVLGATNSFGNKLVIDAGTLQVSTDRNLGAVGSFAVDRITLSNGATLRTTAAFTMNGARGITVGTGGGVLNLNTGALSYAGRFTGAGETVTTAGSAGLTLSNTTATASNVNWDFTGNATRIFFANTDALGTGSARVRSGVRLVSTSATTGTVSSAVTLDSGGGLSARAGAVTFSNVTFPSTGTVVLNKDDQQMFALTVSSGAALTGDLTVDTSQQAAAAVGDVTLSGIFSGASGAITKSGTGASGRLILGGVNTYGGNTTINTGTLALGAAGSIATSPAIILSTGSTAFDVSAVTGFTLGAAQALSGVGAVVGDVTADGTLSPGLSGAAGTLSFANNLSLGSGSILDYQLNGTDLTVGGGVNDLVSLAGNLSLDGTINVAESVPNSFLSATVGNSWRLFNYTGTLTDNTLSLGTMPTLGSGLTFGIDTGTAGQVNLVVNAVPEPATIVTAGVGLGVLATLALRRRRARGAS